MKNAHPSSRPAAPLRARRKPAAVPSGAALPSGIVDLDRYVPAYLTWIANKLSRGASQHYLALFDVGIEVWRCLVLLAVHGSVTAQQVSRVIGMDKGTVSRCFKSMQERGLIRTELDAADGRVRIAVLTPEGRVLHDQIRDVALERERAFLSVLDPKEVEVLLSLLRRLHENLPAVETATQAYVKQRFPAVQGARKRRPPDETEDS